MFAYPDVCDVFRLIFLVKFHIITGCISLNWLMAIFDTIYITDLFVGCSKMV
jgi:hypothetical protein